MNESGELELDNVSDEPDVSDRRMLREEVFQLAGQ
jgi:hypothetical protein